MAPLLGLSFYLVTMDSRSSNDLEFGVAVIDVLPRMGRLLTRVLLVALLMFAVMIFRHLDIGYRLRFFVLRMPGI